MAVSRTIVDFAHFFDYLVLARHRLLQWVADARVEVYTRAFPVGLGSIRGTVLHVADTEWRYVQRLVRRDYMRADSPFAPEGLAALPQFAASSYPAACRPGARASK